VSRASAHKNQSTPARSNLTITIILLVTINIVKYYFFSHAGDGALFKAGVHPILINQIPDKLADLRVIQILSSVRLLHELIFELAD